MTRIFLLLVPLSAGCGETAAVPPESPPALADADFDGWRGNASAKQSLDATQASGILSTILDRVESIEAKLRPPAASVAPTRPETPPRPRPVPEPVARPLPVVGPPIVAAPSPLFPPPAPPAESLAAAGADASVETLDIPKGWTGAAVYHAATCPHCPALLAGLKSRATKVAGNYLRVEGCWFLLVDWDQRPDVERPKIQGLPAVLYFIDGHERTSDRVIGFGNRPGEPSARGSVTKTAQTFWTVGDEPDEQNPVVNGPGQYPWEPSAGPFAPNAGLITPNPYISNSSRGQVTDWLLCSNFGFEIPGNYWITGISIQFKRWSDQQQAASDDLVTVGLISQFNANDGGSPPGNEAQSGAWPLFSATPGADIATYGGQFDDWLNEAAIQGYVNSSEMCFGIGANLGAMSAGAAWVDPSSCQMTVYYVSLPCQDNCCACPPSPSTGRPPSAYQFTVPSCPADCECGGDIWAYDPACGCASQMGQTLELPFSALLSIPTYTCVYTATFGPWTWTLTITNISPDTRNWTLTASTGAACSQPGETTSGTFWVWGYEETSPNLAIQSCNGNTLTLGGDSFDCFCSLHIVIGGGSFSGPSITVTPIP